MPSLNVGSYIETCMESVLGQTLQDIEVISVDADSTDGTHEILAKYAKQDPRVRLFRDDQHSTGYAKNLGIDIAKGEYIGIVEPDDYIELDMFERLYEAAVADRLDVVKCDYSTYVTIDNQHFLCRRNFPLIQQTMGFDESTRNIEAFWLGNVYLGRNLQDGFSEEEKNQAA